MVLINRCQRTVREPHPDQANFRAYCRKFTLAWWPNRVQYDRPGRNYTESRKTQRQI